ncbi:MAG TPA: lactate utilization protein [Terriglobales bacterium]|nr:lactate utilization protein [Terriglobales bacterium]
MDNNSIWYYEKLSAKVLQSLKRNNIEAYYCRTGDEAREKIQGLIPEGSSVGLAGSVTLKEVGILDGLMKGKYKLYNQYVSNLSQEESLRIRREGVDADYFLSGTNAVTLNGELINISGMGNKIAGLTYGKKVVIVCGVNKIVKDVQEGIDRTRNLSAPMNAKRLDFKTPCRETGFCDYDLCRGPEFERMCNQLLVIEGEREKGRITVILIGEELGF